MLSTHTGEPPAVTVHISQSGLLTMGGHGHTGTSSHASSEAAREAALDIVTGFARQSGHPVRLHTTGAEGNWHLVVASDGSVDLEEMPAVVAPTTIDTTASVGRTDTIDLTERTATVSAPPSAPAVETIAMPVAPEPHPLPEPVDLPDPVEPLLPPIPPSPPIPSAPAAAPESLATPEPSAGPEHPATPEPSASSEHPATPEHPAEATSVESTDTAPVDAGWPSETELDEIESLERTIVSTRRRTEPVSRAKLFTSTGTILDVSGSGVLGRRPLGVENPVRFDDPTRSVSNAHLRFTVDGAGLNVEDLASANGTTVVREGTRQQCHPGTTVPAPRGSRVDIGDQFFVVA